MNPTCPLWFKACLAGCLAVVGVAACGPSLSESCARDLQGCAGQTSEHLSDEAEESRAGSSVESGRVYLDLSTSMRGYVGGRSPSSLLTLYQRALDGTIDEGFSSVGLDTVHQHGFGSEIEPQNTPLQLFALQGPGDLQPASRYKQASTDLEAVFRDLAEHPEALSVVITDGVQDLRPQGGGFNRPALVQAITEEVMEKGFGVWLVGLMSEFDGYYFHVRPDRQGKVNQPIRVRKRPFYLWVVSQDVGLGRSWVRYVVTSLERDLGEESADRIKALELSPGAQVQVKVELLSLSSITDHNFFQYNLLKDIALYQTAGKGQAPFACVLLRGDTQDELKLPLSVNLGPDLASDLTLPSSIWQIDLEKLGTPGLVETPELASSLGSSTKIYTLRLDYLDAVRLARNGAFEIPLHLYPNLDGALADHWSQIWSTQDDTTPERIEGKTLYLADVVQGVLERRLQGQRPVGCFHLRLVRQ